MGCLSRQTAKIVSFLELMSPRKSHKKVRKMDISLQRMYRTAHDMAHKKIRCKGSGSFFENGGPGWIRTSDLTVISRAL